MNGKEEKFFDLAREFYTGLAAAGAAFENMVSGKVTAEETAAVIHDTKKKCRGGLGKLWEKMYKAYKNPPETDYARNFIWKSYEIIDILDEMADRISFGAFEEQPREFADVAQLIAAALSEMKKIMDYTADVEGNYMKMEARSRKVHTYEDRGDELFRDEMRALFTGGRDPVYVMYWKDIVTNGEKVLDTITGASVLLQKLLTKY